VVVPDLVGFGKSDKPKKEAAHAPHWHARVLQELAGRLALHSPVLLAPADAPAPALAGLARLAFDAPAPAGAAYTAPFPDAGHRAGPRALAQWPVAGVDPGMQLPGTFDLEQPQAA